MCTLCEIQYPTVQCGRHDLPIMDGSEVISTQSFVLGYLIEITRVVAGWDLNDLIIYLDLHNEVT